MDIQKDKKTKENIKGKRKRGLIVPLFLAYQYVIYRCVQQPAQGIQIVDRRKALTVLPFRHRLSCHITCLSNVILCKLILFSVKLNIVTYQNKYLQFNYTQNYTDRWLKVKKTLVANAQLWEGCYSILLFMSIKHISFLSQDAQMV